MIKTPPKPNPTNQIHELGKYLPLSSLPPSTLIKLPHQQPNTICHCLSIDFNKNSLVSKESIKGCIRRKVLSSRKDQVEKIKSKRTSRKDRVEKIKSRDQVERTSRKKVKIQVYTFSHLTPNLSNGAKFGLQSLAIYGRFHHRVRLPCRITPFCPLDHDNKAACLILRCRSTTQQGNLNTCTRKRQQVCEKGGR